MHVTFLPPRVLNGTRQRELSYHAWPAPLEPNAPRFVASGCSGPCSVLRSPPAPPCRAQSRRRVSQPCPTGRGVIASSGGREGGGGVSSLPFEDPFHWQDIGYWPGLSCQGGMLLRPPRATYIEHRAARNAQRATGNLCRKTSSWTRHGSARNTLYLFVALRFRKYTFKRYYSTSINNPTAECTKRGTRCSPPLRTSEFPL